MPRFIAFLCLMAAASAPAQQTDPPAAAEPRAYDLSIARRVGRPLLIEIKSEAAGSMDLTVTAAGGKKEARTLPYAVECRTEIVDDFTEVSAERIAGRRFYLLDHRTDDRAVRDSTRNGITFAYEHYGTNVAVEPLGNRLLPTKDANAELLRVEGLGAMIDLPRAVTPGSPIEVPCTPLAVLLFDLADEPGPGIATVKLDEVDEETGLATLSGTLRAEEREVLDDIEADIVTTYEGPCRLRIDTRNHVLVSFECSGSASASGTIGGAPARGKLAFESRMTVKPGPPAARALKKKTRYRLRDNGIRSLGLTFKLPSHWFSAGDSAEGGLGWQYISAVRGKELMQQVFLRVFPTPQSEKELDPTADAMVEQLKEHAPKKSSFKTKAGPARSVRADIDDKIQINDIIAHPRALIRIIMLAPKKHAGKALEDLATLRNTLQLR